MLKLGRVDQRDANTGRVRVVFGADDALVSMMLPVLQSRAHEDRVVWMPDADEYVCCLLDDRAEFGVVLGSIYTADDALPVVSLEKFHVAFKDGTSIEYDRASHALAITIAEEGTVAVNAKNVTIDVPHDGMITLAGDDPLVRKSWVEQRFDLHVHVAPLGPPTPVAPVPTWFTQRVQAG